MRAEAFAGALLVSGEWASEYLAASGVRKGEPPPPEVLLAIQEYFDASLRAVLSRLLTLGWLRGEDVEGLARRGLRFDESESGPGGNGGPGAGRAIPVFPERYVSLVVRAHRDGVLTLKELAGRLELSPGDARDLLHTYGVEAKA
jgi:hypothetical protein